MSGPRMMFLPAKNLKLIKEFLAEDKKWNEDLFSPKGLSILFGKGNKNGKKNIKVEIKNSKCKKYNGRLHQSVCYDEWT